MKTMPYAGSAGSGELVLDNGKIVTMDEKNAIVSSVTIKNGRIASTGRDARSQGSGAKVIDLRGRTVIPGLIDNHMHFLRTGLLPGHDMRALETAFSVAEALDAVREKAATVPEGEFLSALGGIHPTQFAENRFPNLAELDAAAPYHPVYLSVSSFGPGVTNSLAKAILEDRGIDAGDGGEIAKGAATAGAWNTLSALHTYAETVRQTRNQMAFAVGLGLTTIFDNGGTIPEGGWLDPATGYDPLLALMREGKIPLRIRLFFPILDTDPGLPQLKARLDNAFREFGNDLVKISGLGEWLIPHALQTQKPLPTLYEDSVHVAAERGWIYMQHMITLDEQKAHLDVWERVNDKVPLADLHWAIDHGYGMDLDTLNRAKALGIGIAAHSTAYLAGRAMENGNPPFRMMLDSGIHVGGGSDGARISTMNPWLMIYYMVTGRNCAGEMINPGQTITRMEALRLWTAAQGWFSKEEDGLGSIEVGKLADLVVLSGDYPDPDAVSDEEIRDLSSVLTIVGGEIVHDTGALA